MVTIIPTSAIITPMQATIMIISIVPLLSFSILTMGKKKVILLLGRFSLPDFVNLVTVVSLL